MCRLARCLSLAIALWASHARAQSTGAPPEPEASPLPSAHWGSSKARPFLAGLADAGGLLRTKWMVGYGKPHWMWAGVEGEGVTTSEMGLSTVRARLAFLIVDAAVAYRKTWSYRRSWVDREASYRDDDLRGGDKAAYHSLDLWLWGLIPVGSGYFDWEVESVHLLGVPRGKDLYEEWLRVVVRPSWAVAGRFGYVQTFKKGRLGFGVLGEWIWPGPRASTYRVGPLVNYAFNPRWDIALLMTTVVKSPDELSFYNGLWGTLRARYRFAFGDKRSPLSMRGAHSL